MENPDIKFFWNTSDGDDIVQGFYRPALENAILYQRKSGYFSSTTFVEISTEMIDFIKRNGRMQLITSPMLSSYDISILEQSVENRDEYLSKLFFDDLANDPSGTKQHFAQLMGYMLANQIDGKPQLEIKIAQTSDGKGIFHTKFGILHQANGELIGFLGSNNETGSGMNVNDEAFNAICSWHTKNSRKQVEQYQTSFENLWNQKNTATRIFDLPDAIRKGLLKISPKSNMEYQKVLKDVYDDIDNIKKNSDESSFVDEPDNETDKPKDLYDYQKSAIDKWMENNCRGIFEMATGTGKTFSSFGCISKFMKNHSRTVTIIACPQTHLVEQWVEALKVYNSIMPDDIQVHFDDSVTCYGEKNWKPKFGELVYDFNKKTFAGKNVISNFIVFVTHDTLNSTGFKEYIDELPDSKILLVVDEMHNIGSELKLNSLLDRYDYRLGLSATPIRHYDQAGSDALKKYFEKIVYEYSLANAIKDGYLCEYYYYPIYADLTSEEMDVYNDLTKQIAAKMNNNKTIVDENDTNDPRNRRAALVGNAENKLVVLEKILNDLNWKLDKALIYCTSHPSPNLPKGSKTQLENVNEFLANGEGRHFTVKSVTYRDPTKSRGEILNNLATGHYDVITAVQCLDEGVDVPSAETAIIMASSGNPKQYIQRRGRVLRTNEKGDKKFAVIYDILVKPPKSDDESIKLRERKLIAKELLRHQDFARIAKNSDEAFESIKEVKEYFEIPNDLTQEKIDTLE